MDENMMNNVVEEVVENVEVPEVVQDQKSIGSVVLGLGAIAAFGIGMFVHKNKVRFAEKRIARQIKNLEKKGYLVDKKDDIENMVIEEVEPIE